MTECNKKSFQLELKQEQTAIDNEGYWQTTATNTTRPMASTMMESTDTTSAITVRHMMANMDLNITQVLTRTTMDSMNLSTTADLETTMKASMGPTTMDTQVPIMMAGTASTMRTSQPTRMTP